MRSTARFRSHPLHPMLVAFPVAFGTAAPAFDLAGVLGGWPTVWAAGAYLASAAVIAGLVAGVPGFVDYRYTVPPDSSAKRRATWHMAVNLTALALIALGWAFRDAHSLRPGVWTIVLEAAGLGLMARGGWLGATLVYRNQIGVDHRYARAGKWKEQDVVGPPGEPAEVAAAGELEVGQMKLLRVRGRRIVLARAPDGYAAFDDHCTHRGGSLAGGVMACGRVVCPWHGSTFDVRTGAVEAGPADRPVATYPVEERDGRVFLVVPSPG